MGRGKYCSVRCRNIGNNKSARRMTGIYVFCSNCANCINVRAYYLKRNRKNHFCNKKCEAEFNRGPRNPFFGKKHSQKTLAKILQSVHGKPNKAERRLLDIMLKNNLPFRFVGDGSLIIDGMNPDFVNTNTPTQLIELFGVYWHKVRKTPFHKTELGRIAAYENLGYRCLIVWETELSDEEALVQKINRFVAQEVITAP